MTTITADAAPSEEQSTSLRMGWGWLLALGVVQILGGALAIAVPAIASLAAVMVIGWLLIVAAVFHIIHAFKVRKWPGFALHLLGAILYGAAGVLVLLYPIPGALTLTLFIASLLTAEGVLRSVLAFQLRPRTGWGWFLIGGMASLVLGVMLFVGWPATAIWAIGLLLGINMVITGSMNVSLALFSRTARADRNRRAAAAT
jgi:uncharacterized membrane protein HdeD (DUF308 family)